VHVVFATLQSREVSAMGPLYLAGALRRAGHSVALVQARTAGEVVAAIAREKPRDAEPIRDADLPDVPLE
jgi:hypothetical protein